VGWSSRCSCRALNEITKQRQTRLGKLEEEGAAAADAPAEFADPHGVAVSSMGFLRPGVDKVEGPCESALAEDCGGRRWVFRIRISGVRGTWPHGLWRTGR
jgi:hypothetical protein